MKIAGRPNIDEAVRLFDVELQNARAKLTRQLGC
jgi:hypothetical protein